MNDERDDQLVERHRRLGERLREFLRTISNFAATLRVTERADESRLETALDETSIVLGTLGAWLEVLEDRVERARGARDEDRRRELLETYAALEPPLEETVDEQSDGEEDGGARAAFDDVSPARLLSVPYDLLLDVEKEMYGERIRRPFRFVVLKEIWGDFAYLGGDRPGDALPARLPGLHDRLERAVDPDESLRLFDRDVREALDELRGRAEDAATWDADVRAKRECDRWVDRVQKWVRTAESDEELGHHSSEMMERFLTDLPAEPDARVRDLLDRISEAEGFPESIRATADRLP